jgi:hypothetical protein
MDHDAYNSTAPQPAVPFVHDPTRGGSVPEGSFVGGPLDGMTYTLRSESNVLAVDPDEEVAWLYKRLPDQPSDVLNYTLDITPGETDPATGARVFDEDRAVAAVEAGYDVIVIPGIAPTQDEIDDEEVLTDGE